MSLHIKDRPALILIGIQKGFDNIEYWGEERNNPDAERNASELLKLWRKNGLPILHIKHCSADPSSPLNEKNSGNEFKDLVKPEENEIVIRKYVNSAFIGTKLQEVLLQLQVTNLVIIGLTSDHCVSTTARMAGNFGFETFLISDATATFNRKGLHGENYSAEFIHRTALASLDQEFGIVISTLVLKNMLFIKDY